MSIINKMLQELDRRQGMADPDSASVMPQVQVARGGRKDREWFWRIVALLMIAAVGWVAWIAWQLQPRPSVVTDQAFKAAENAIREPKTVAVPSKAATEVSAAEARPAAGPVATLHMAPVIDTPIAEKPARTAARGERKSPAVSKAAPAAPKGAVAAAEPAGARLGLDVPPARILQPPAGSPARVEKRDRTRSPEDRAEAEFRRAASLLNLGRVGEAEEGFIAALAAYPGHEAARQALVALNLEQRRIDEARRLLQEGVALNPANPRFASVLARIFIERRDYPGALDVLEAGRKAGADNAELQALRGTALQRLGQHADAAEAFQSSLRGEPQSGATWMGLGISLESLGRKPEAADAYRRAAATGTLSAEARNYAEQRSRLLR